MRSLRRPHRLLLAALLVVCVAIAMTPRPGGAASSSTTVVSATVPTATSFTDSFTASPAVSFGVVQPGSSATTTTGAQVCRFGFGSSNETSMLRISQTDGAGTAMTLDSPSWSNAATDSEPQRAVSIAPANPGTAMVVDGWGAARATVNSGANWNAVTNPAGAGCDSVAMGTTAVAYAGCGTGIINKTGNTGGSWAATAATGMTGAVVAMDAANASVVIAGSYTGEVRYTNNGGTSWLTPTTPPPAGSRINAIDMVNASTGFLIRNSGSVVYRTDDGGATWSALTMAGGGGSCYGLSAASTTVIWVSCDGTVQRSTNGSSFTATAMDTYTPLPRIAAVDSNNAVVGGWYGELYRTNSGGSSWTQVGAGITSENITGLKLDGTRMYATGAGGVILSSNDSGSTWVRQRIRTNGEFLDDVVQYDSTRAWAVGDSGKIRASTDSGQTWSNQTSGTTVNLHGVTALSTTTVVAVGDGGTILRTTDAGTTWSPVTSGTSQNLLEVDSESGNQLLAVGDNGIVLRSDTGGTSWTTVRDSSTSTTKFRDVAWANPSTAWIVGDGQRIERSLDGGRTWTQRTIPPSASGEPFTSIDISGDGTRIVVGPRNYGRLYVSSDSGATWANAAGAGALNQVDDVEWHGSGVIDVVSVGAIQGSDDSGATITTDTNVWHQLGGIDSLDTSRGITVGEGGSIQWQVPGTTISDYGAGGTWGSASSTNMFGVCLQAIGGSSIADWTRDVTGTSGVCEAADSDPWQAIPTAPTKVAHTNTAGQSGTVDLVFGFRPSQSQPKGTYRAKFSVEVVAPWS